MKNEEISRITNEKEKLNTETSLKIRKLEENLNEQEDKNNKLSSENIRLNTVILDVETENEKIHTESKKIKSEFSSYREKIENEFKENERLLYIKLHDVMDNFKRIHFEEADKIKNDYTEIIKTMEKKINLQKREYKI